MPDTTETAGAERTQLPPAPVEPVHDWAVPPNYPEFVEHSALLPELVPLGRHSMGVGYKTWEVRDGEHLGKLQVRLFHLAGLNGPARDDKRATMWWWDFTKGSDGNVTLKQNDDLAYVTPVDLCAVYAAFEWAETSEGKAALRCLNMAMCK